MDGGISTLKLEVDGRTFAWLTFEIGPTMYGVPYHDGPPEVTADGHRIWHRESGSTIEDLTLSPSYHVRGRVHGWIRDGRWVDCGDEP